MVKPLHSSAHRAEHHPLAESEGLGGGGGGGVVLAERLLQLSASMILLECSHSLGKVGVGGCIERGVAMVQFVLLLFYFHELS